MGGFQLSASLSRAAVYMDATLLTVSLHITKEPQRHEADEGRQELRKKESPMRSG